MPEITSVFSRIKKLLIGLLLIVIAALCFVFCQSKGERTRDTHLLYGFWNDASDGTLIFLEIDDQVDSTHTSAGKFTFDLSPYKQPKWALIRTEGYKHYKFFWTDKEDIRFSIDKGFDRIQIAGSKLNDTFDSLSNFVDPLMHDMDSLKRLLGDHEQKESDTYNKISKIEEKLRRINTEFIRRHPSNVLGAFVLSSNMRSLNADTVKRLFGGLSKKMSDTEYYQDVLNFIELHADVSIGNQYVDFTQNDPNGKPIRLSQFEGKVILLEFWASWCVPCRRHNPELVKIFKKYHKNGLEILSVSLDSKTEKWVNAIVKDSLTWHHVNDGNGNRNKAAVIYGINAIPQSFLIDRRGTIVARDLRGKALENELNKALNTLTK